MTKLESFIEWLELPLAGICAIGALGLSIFLVAAVPTRDGLEAGAAVIALVLGIIIAPNLHMLLMLGLRTIIRSQFL